MKRSILVLSALPLLLCVHDVRAQQRDLQTVARAYVAAHEPVLLREFAELLSLPNLASDSAAIHRNADFLVAMLQRRGVSARLLDGQGAPPIVFGELRAPGATRTIILYAHYDGQPLNPAQWSSPPWQPTLRDAAIEAGGKVIAFPADGAPPIGGEARLYARSSGDDKASIMGMLAALDALRAAQRQPTVNLKFFFEGEEEQGSPHLARILDANRELLAGDVWLFCDGPNHQSGRQQLLFGMRGITGLELTVYGPTRPLHSGHYGGWAPNPAAMIAELIATMRDADGRITIDGYYDEVVPPSAAEHAAVAALPPVDSALRASLGLGRVEGKGTSLAELVMQPALNVRGIRAGAVAEQAANAIPTYAQASFDFRLVPKLTPERVRSLVNAHLERQGYFVTADSVTTAMRLAHARVAHVAWDDGGYPAGRTPLDLPIARAVAAAITAGLGQAPLLVPTMGGSGPHYLFQQLLNTPVIVLPIANYDDNQHGADENLRIQNLRDGVGVYVGVFAGMK